VCLTGYLIEAPSVPDEVTDNVMEGLADLVGAKTVATPRRESEWMPWVTSHDEYRKFTLPE